MNEAISLKTEEEKIKVLEYKPPHVDKNNQVLLKNSSASNNSAEVDAVAGTAISSDNTTIQNGGTYTINAGFTGTIKINTTDAVTIDATNAGEPADVKIITSSSTADLIIKNLNANNKSTSI